MSVLHGKTNRRMVPRWRSSNNAVQAIEFGSLRPRLQPRPDVDPGFDESRRAFSLDPSLGTAAEVISTAIFAGRADDAEPARRFILDNAAHAPRTLVAIAGGESVIQASTPEVERSTAVTRRLLRLQPDNPLLWSDMARHYASIGDRRNARRAINTALQLAPNHRWLLRTTARVLAHVGDPAAAHKLLANHPRTRQDPWLVAAELACAQVAGRAPKFWRQANDLLKWGAHAPAHLSELAAAVGMLELEGGERRRARKFVQKGLVAPTENTLAQVFWAKENRHLSDGFDLDHLVLSVTDAYEADFQLNATRGNLEAAMTAATTWSEDEPFASRPKAEIAYLASLLDDYSLVTESVDQIYRLDGQKDATLDMNGIFATISSGRYNVSEHVREIVALRDRLVRAIEKGGADQYHAIANLGLWSYRYGDPVEGKTLYQAAITAAQKTHNLHSAALAATFAARESVLARSDTASQDLDQARQLSLKASNKGAEFYVRKLEALIVDPGSASLILSRHYKPQPAPSPKKPLRVTKSDGRYTIWLPTEKNSV